MKDQEFDELRQRVHRLERIIRDGFTGMLARELAELELKHESYDRALEWYNDGKHEEPDAEMLEHLKVFDEYCGRAERFLGKLGFRQLWKMTDEVRALMINALEKPLQ